MSSASEKRTASGDGIRANILFGLAVSVLLVGGVGAWAATTSLAGAVISSGTVVVESNAKKVQHQTGGVVGAILVREGDRVSAGDVIVRLDETTTHANLQIITQQYDRTVARQARLQAERIGLPEIKFPDDLAKRATDPDLAVVIAGEKALFESRTKALSGLKSQLETRTGQFRKQIEGLTAQRKATDEAAALIERDFNSLQKLYEKKLISLERVSALQLELSRLQGESGRLAAAIAETEGKISETALQALQVDEEMRKEVNEELRELDGKEVELIERKVVAEDQLARTEIRAPQSGFVQELAIHTVGGVDRTRRDADADRSRRRTSWSSTPWSRPPASMTSSRGSRFPSASRPSTPRQRLSARARCNGSQPTSSRIRSGRSLTSSPGPPSTTRRPASRMPSACSPACLPKFTSRPASATCCPM